jgi:Right handed beta helix region
MARIPPVASACIAAVVVTASLVVSNAFAAEGPDGAIAPNLAASAVTVLYVDRNSVGGRCSNARSAAQAASPRTPWCSLKRAVAAAPSGSTVLVRAGSYPELEVEDDRHRSTWVTLRRYPSEHVRVAGISLNNTTNLRILGFRITRWVNLGDGTANVALVRNNISPRGVRLRSVEAILLAGNRIHDLAPRTADGKCSCGIWAQAWDDHGVRDVTVRGNVITGTSDDGIQFGNGYDILIEGNTVVDSLSIDDGSHVDSVHIMGGDGIRIRNNRFQHNQHGLMFTDRAAFNVVIENNVVADIVYGAGLNTGDIPGARIVNNTFWRTRYGVMIRDDDRDTPTPSGIVFVNNIVDYQRSSGHWFATHDYNLIAGGSMYGSHDRSGSASFRDPLGGDFTLAAGSQGIDAGTSNHDAPSVDRAGQARRDDPDVANTGGGDRDWYDIGAQEP